MDFWTYLGAWVCGSVSFCFSLVFLFFLELPKFVGLEVGEKLLYLCAFWFVSECLIYWFLVLLFLLKGDNRRKHERVKEVGALDVYFCCFVWKGEQRTFLVPCNNL